jgi:DNA-binding CsgD family transcriptional regulator
MGGRRLAAVTSFVGRDVEYAAAKDHVESALDGWGSTLLISGEAGVGKTTLMDQVLAEGSPDGRVVLRAAGLPLESLSSPFMVVRAMVRRLPDGVPRPPTVADARGGTGGVDPVEFDAWLDDVSITSPVVLAVDDLHWVDRESLDVLRYVIAGGRSRPLVVVLTLRTEELAEGHPLHRWLADVRRLPGFDELHLGPLDRISTWRQMAVVMGGEPHQSLVDEVFGRSGGNPYLTRLLVTGVEPGATRLPEGAASRLEDAVLAAWHGMSPEARELTTVLAIAGRGLPRPEIQDLVAGRLETESVPGLLREAEQRAVLEVDPSGRYWFHHPLQAEMLGSHAHPQDRRDWHEVCAKLLESQLGDEPDPATMAAIADHYYAAGLTEEAYRWSLRVAGAQDRGVGTPDVIRALTRALALHPHITAPAETRVDLLWPLRDALATVGDQERELAVVEQLLTEVDQRSQPEVAAELLVGRMHLRMSTGTAWWQPSDIEGAVELLRSRPGTWQHAVCLSEYSDVLIWDGQLERGAAIAKDAVAMAEANGHHVALAHAFSARSVAETNSGGDPQQARMWARRARQEAVAARDWQAAWRAVAWEAAAAGPQASVEGVETAERGRIELIRDGCPHVHLATLAGFNAQTAVDVGDLALARRLLRFALGASPGWLADVLTRLVAVRLAALTGALGEAEQHMARVDEVRRALPEYKGVPLDVIRAEYQLATGHPRAAVQTCRQALDGGGLNVHRCEWLLPLTARALADLADGARVDGADPRAVLTEATEFAERYPPGSEDESGASPILLDAPRYDLAYVVQVRAFDAWYAAELARARRSPDAVVRWQRAADQLDRGGLPWEAAYAWMRLAEARLLGSPMDRAPVVEALRGAAERARPLDARPVLEKVEALARSARIDVSVVPQTLEDRGLPGLTRREREILEHVVAGRTYGEIAEALVVSEKTVSSHISNMLRKTGTSNRHELAARARAASS